MAGESKCRGRCNNSASCQTPIKEPPGDVRASATDCNRDLRSPAGHDTDAVPHWNPVASIEFTEGHHLDARPADAVDHFPEQRQRIAGQIAWLRVNAAKREDQGHVMYHGLMNGRKYLSWRGEARIPPLPVTRIMNLKVGDFVRIAIWVRIGTIRHDWGEHVIVTNSTLEFCVCRP